MYIKVMSILSFLPLLFLSQSLVFIAVVFIVIIFWLSVSNNIYHIFTVIKFLFNLVVRFKYISLRLNSITNEKKKKSTTK